MAEDSKTAWGREKLFALDWRGFAAQGILGDVLRLFSLRRAWLERCDQKAYAELVRAGRAANANIRAVAGLILAEMARSDKANDSALTSKVNSDAPRKHEPWPYEATTSSTQERSVKGNHCEMNMNTKALIFMAALVTAADSLWSQSGAGSRNSSSPTPQSQIQARAEQRIREQEQRSLLQHCRNMAELARNHTSELLGSATHGRANLETLQPHLREVRSAVDSMLEDHRRLLYSLTEEQWTAAKDPITALERLRGSIQTQIQGIDLELQMPTPDSKVLIRYEKKLRALLKEWRRQHRRMAATIGVSL